MAFVSLTDRGRAVLPAGASAAARHNVPLDRTVYFASGAGARLVDTDGHALIDLTASQGASLLGHGHPAIRAAVEAALDRGFVCGADGEQHVALAETLAEILPGVEMVRLVTTGTEATMAAIRLARAATGRTKVLKFDGHFHGGHDQVLVTTMPAGAPGDAPTASSAGVPQEVVDLALSLPFNDRAALDAAFAAHGPELACAILEPVAYNMGCVPADPAWLAALRDHTRACGALLIFDEVLSGFRMALGGGQEHFGITADLVTVAKALGAGWPIAAVGGRRAVLELAAPLGGVFISGTYSGHDVAVSAARAALDVVRAPGFYPALEARGAQLQDGLEALFAEHGVLARVQRVGSRFAVYFGIAAPVTDFAGGCAHDQATLHAFERRAYAAGVLVHEFGRRRVPPHWGITAAHTADVIDETIERLRPVVAGLAQGGDHVR